jgi:putative ABC transport system permease protein
MYPGLLLPLGLAVGLIAVALLGTAVLQPVLRKLAARQVARRRTEAVLVVTGSLLGTAIIVGALVVGDTLGFSVRQTAYRTLGPIDERVVSSSSDAGDRLGRLTSSPDVDGVLTVRALPSAALRQTPSGEIAEPRVLVWDVDVAAARRLGATAGVTWSPPAEGHVVLNEPLARSLHAQAGDTVSLYLQHRAVPLVVDRVVAEKGLAGTGFGANQNRDAFLPAGTLRGTSARWVTLISNRGDVESGSARTDAVVGQAKTALGSLATSVTIETPKREVLRTADVTGDSLGALFLMIGSFSVIAGALLLVNIFVMLAQERRAQLGMLRAAGLKRSRLVGAFSLEGALYAAGATALGVLVGLGVGWVVAFAAARIFSSWSTDGSGLDVTFRATPTSLANGAAMGFVIAVVSVVLTSARISRFNIIAAIRDLDVEPAARTRQRLRRAGLVAAAVLALASVPTVASSSPVGTFLLPALAVGALTPWITERLGKRLSYSLVASVVLGWTLIADVVRPDVFDTPSMTVYVVLGTQLAFSSVMLVSQNQQVVLRPLRRLIRRPDETGLAVRLGTTYPVARPFRTGATLVMYTLITLVLVLLTEISGVLEHSIDSQVASATSGFALRIDVATPDALVRVQDVDVTAVVPLVTGVGWSTDPGLRTTEPISTLVIGVPTQQLRQMQFTKRLSGLRTDADVWAALDAHPDWVLVDPFFGATGGPAGEFYAPGDRFTVTDPRTGRTSTKTIAGVLRIATSFYSPSQPAAFPLVTSRAAVEQQFGTAATATSALVRDRAGSDPAAVASRLQARLLDASLVATPLESTVRRLFAANVAFFQLMEGFLALGLLVGITGLGVVMVRAVRERRRTIGILRALGFRARTIERAFLVESGFVATEGVVLGAVLGVLTTWLMYQRSAAFSGLHTGFPILWTSTAALCLVTVVASLLATVGPARRAAHVLPALATRTAD